MVIPQKEEKVVQTTLKRGELDKQTIQKQVQNNNHRDGRSKLFDFVALDENSKNEIPNARIRVSNDPNHPTTLGRANKKLRGMLDSSVSRISVKTYYNKEKKLVKFMVESTYPICLFRKSRGKSYKVKKGDALHLKPGDILYLSYVKVDGKKVRKFPFKLVPKVVESLKLTPKNKSSSDDDSEGENSKPKQKIKFRILLFFKF